MDRNIKFDNGLKTYVINGDENVTISFNPSDFNIMARLETAEKGIDKIAEKYKNIDASENPIQLALECDKQIRENINFVFGSDVCTNAFGSTNCLSYSNGQPIYMNFLEAIIPLLKKEITAEKKKSQKNIEKYTKQVKK